METQTATGDGFNPSTVPPYPVLTLTGADDPDNVSVDQEPISGENAFERALEICAERAADLGGAVRVRGVDSAGREWPMVVTSSGALYDLSVDDATATPKRRVSRRVLVIGGVVGAGALAAGAGFGIPAIVRAVSKPPAPEPPPKYPGKGAALPVRPPAGADTVSTWAVVVDPDSPVSVLQDSHLAIVPIDGNPTVVTQDSGQVEWVGSGGDVPSTFHQITIGATAALSSYSNDGIQAWPLNGGSSRAVQSLPVLDGRADSVITSGPLPLFVLPSQTAQIFADSKMARVDIPVPAIPAGAITNAAIAVDADHVVIIDPSNAAEARALGAHPGGVDPDAARVLGPDHVAIAWQGDEGRSMTLHRIVDGATVATSPMARFSPNDEPHEAPGQRAWVWQDTLIRPTADQPLVSLTSIGGDARIDVDVVTDTDLWGRQDSTRVRIPLDTLSPIPEHPDTVFPTSSSASGDIFYFIAEKLDKTILYAVQAQPAEPAPAEPAPAEPAPAEPAPAEPAPGEPAPAEGGQP